MEVMAAVQSGTCSESTAQKKSFCLVPPRRGEDFNEVFQAIKKKSRPFLSTGVTPFACNCKLRASFCLNKASASDSPML